MAQNKLRNDEAMSSTESNSSGGSDADWDDAESDHEEPLAIVSLLDDAVFADVTSMLEHCKKQYDFDFVGAQRRLALDFHGSVRLVNFIRQRVLDGVSLPVPIRLEDIDHDQYLKPVVEDDALIMSLDELHVDDHVEPLSKEGSVLAGEVPSTQSLLASKSELERELAAVKAQFANYRTAVEQTLDHRWGDDTDPGPAAPPRDQSQYYWESLADPLTQDIHETMLKDVVRTDAYRDFVYENKALFKGKVVLDIGCGTGILSMFCAKAGAKMVYAVDKSDIIDKARENVYHNGLSDTITLLKGRIEDISLPVDSVDIIISEWMGYCLLYEAMLPSVLYARDKYLRPDGILVPSVSTIWVAPVSDPEFVADHVSFWDDVYGFDMKALKAGIYDEARIDIWPSSTICGAPAQISYLDLHTVKAEELNFTAQWNSTLSRDIVALDGFLIWFDCFFTKTRAETIPPGVEAKPRAGKDQSPVVFTTGPYGPDTHWKQGFLLADQSKGSVAVKCDTKVSGQVTFKAPEDNPRALRISTTWTTGDTEQMSQTWKLR
ncbi:S-adenosylmethionine-dependent methyltransferase superfamily domain-containing protein [Verticillium alfalfae VaMs.102]|uniref:type I protein arginine methyltransferase n=1 Tax=Verticillium alfalfae (strain VaMs.102 / ATCC MYA-4576 / FGSC 10136) TaxID=526221 RepID=C9SA96_VERA1|nr:S-adenosylmethionine-dependent methyltransferase superfamily domain-containing protein [Verticillium alfalfae VaMs.102]EEY15373.1 HNRNP arginine N-methyltransferase [Verticillium alfalfae VaMs.102]